MLVGACIAVLLCQSKVNDVDQVALLAKAHEEVVRLHITVDEVLRVNELIRLIWSRRGGNGGGGGVKWVWGGRGGG